MNSFIRWQIPTANILYIVAVLQLFLGAIYGWFYWASLEHSYWQGWAFVFSAPVFLALGFFVRWAKYYALLIGFLFYLYLAFTVHALPYAASGFWQDGLALKLPVLTLLLWGLLAEDDWKQPKRKWHALLTAILIVICGFGVQYAIRAIIGVNDWIADAQDSLRGAASNLPKETRMNQIVNIFCEANSKFTKLSIINGCILGVSSFGLFLVLVKAITQMWSRRPKKNDAVRPH